jgi:ComF family protein
LTAAAASPNVSMMLPLVSEMLGLCRIALRAVLPADCMSCAQALGMDRTPYFCDACWGGITPISGPRCSCCDQPFASTVAVSWTPTHRCQHCLVRPPAYDRAWTLYPYIPPLQDAICAFKYRNVFDLAKPLASLMIRALPEELEADVIVPVPLHPSRLRTREFNQSLLIADRVARSLMRPVAATDFVRTVATDPQTSLTRQKRLRNLRQAFAVRHAKPFAERRVLLIDDVFTTGTTLNECAKALRSAGAVSVSALTLARTIDSSLVPDRIWAERSARSFTALTS